MAAVGSEGGDEDGSNGAVTGDDLKVSSSYSYDILEQDLGGEGGHAKGTGGIP